MTIATVIEIEINDGKSEHVLYSNENSERLVVIFPGGNNSCDRPILHYLRKYFLDNNYDVLCISYKNLFKRENIYKVKLSNVLLVINKTLKMIQLDKQYVDKIFVSRSFGNVVSNELKINESIEVSKSIYISPTSEAIKYFKDYPGFIVTANNDEYLKDNNLTELVELSNGNILIFKDGTHSLESTNIIDTINFHKDALSKIIQFINN